MKILKHLFQIIILFDLYLNVLTLKIIPYTFALPNQKNHINNQLS